jgi:hypothetical protein
LAERGWSGATGEAWVLQGLGIHASGERDSRNASANGATG